MSEKVVTLEYLPKQADFMAAVDEYPHSAYIGGVGSGKTHVLCMQALREAAYPNTRGLIGAPSYRMLADITMKKFFELCPENWIAKYSVTRNTVLLKNGSEIIFRSFDNEESLQGHDLDWFGGDEMGLVEEGVFKQMQARLRRPGGRHKAFIVGNPSGPTHWTYAYFVVKAQTLHKDYKLIQATSYENAFTPDSYKEQMEKSFDVDSLYYKRFVLGQFVAFEGAYWPNFNIVPYPKGHIVKKGLEGVEAILGKRDASKWYFGRTIDFGFEHPFVCLWWVHNGERLVFYDEYWARHSTIREHLLNIRKQESEHKTWFGVHSAGVTWTDHDAQARHEIHNCVDYEGRNIGFQCSPCEKKNFVMESIICVQSLIEQDRIYISERCEQSRLEIPSYRAKPLDKTEKEQPIKEKDDTCDCVRMTCWMELRALVSFLRIDPDADKKRAPEKIEFTRVTPSSMQDAFQEYGPDALR